jgi:hypothetical protein
MEFFFCSCFLCVYREKNLSCEMSSLVQRQVNTSPFCDRGSRIHESPVTTE